MSTDKCWLCDVSYTDEIQHLLDNHGTYCVGHDHEGKCDIRCINQCDLCYGYPCICEEEKTYKPIWTVFWWNEEERTMIRINDRPLSPKLKRMLDNSTLL